MFAALALAAGLSVSTITGNQANAAPLATTVTAASAVTTASAGIVASGVPGDIYVDNASNANCSDTGSASGNEAQPFCTIVAAEGVVQPGQTIVVEPGFYAPVTVSVSGTPGNPITLLGATTGVATVAGSPTASAFLISGVHDVVISGFVAQTGSKAAAYEIDGQSSDITINDGKTESSKTEPGVQVDVASNVTVSRGSFEGGTGVQVNPGASGVDIAGNTVVSNIDPGIAVTGAPGTDVAGNTLQAWCGQGIVLTGASTGGAIENNIVQGACSTSTPETAISVSADSVTGATADYNLLDPLSGSDLYDWGGTGYTDLADFTSATGQGTHDFAEDPGLGNQVNVTSPGIGSAFEYVPASGSPAIDSANADAPGELPADQFGNPRSDDPAVPNTGAGSGRGTSTGYFDRGAVELVTGGSFSWPSVAPSGPLTATVTHTTAPTSSWTTNEPPVMVNVYKFGDGTFPVITTDSSNVEHTYQAAGLHTVSIEQGFPGYPLAATSAQVVVGADYTPLTPIRVLDTRNGTGVAAKAVAAGGTVTLPVAGANGVPANATAVVMNVAVLQEQAAGWVAVYPGTGSPPGVANLSFTKGKAVTNLVTAKVSGGEVSFRNGSSGTVELVADLQGYYGPGGSGLQPQSPSRVLDTRSGLGAAKQPLASGGRIRLNLSGKVPAGTTAAVLNVTVTAPQQAGWLAAYPDTTGTPGTASLSFARGQTVANLVIVPLNNGVADLFNGSRGTVQVIGDLQGYFSAGAPDSFVPYGPVRSVDTRSTGAIQKGGAVYVLPDQYNSCSSYVGCPDPVAVVDNLTAAQPTGNGYLTAYPYDAARPVAANVPFAPGVTVSNLAMTALSSGEFAIYNGSGGSVQVIADEFGYFIANG